MPTTQEEAPGRLTVTFDNRNPIELGDLTLSLFSLADEYKRFAARQVGSAAAGEVKLYVNQIREGSIIVDLYNAAAPYSPLAAGIIPLVTGSNHIVQFGKHLTGAYGYLLGKQKSPGTALEKANLKNLEEIVEPVAKDPGSNIKFEVGDNNSGQIIFAPILVLDSTQANASQNQIRREIERMGESASGMKRSALLYWNQTRNVANSVTGDKAIIESISPNPVKVSVSPELKSRMINGDRHPYKTAYVVDVDVQTINGKPALYHITALHDMFDIEPQDQTAFEI